MLAVGSLKAAAKRTAFGDVSNTAKTLSNVHDDSVTTGKHVYQEIVKLVAPHEKSSAFLRPAQRPLNGGPKGPSNINSSSSDPISALPRAPAEPRQQGAAIKRTLSKKNTSIYKDVDLENVQPAQIDANQSARPGSAPVAPVHQTLGPRQHKSQPQFNHIPKQDQPSLRRAQSKLINNNLPEPSQDPIPSDPVYEDAPEVQITTSDEAYDSYLRMIDQEREETEKAEKASKDAIERQLRQLPAPPLVSEPEEYWEDEEEEIYDEQGYTTAHSYRSRGDNTTGGATTVLFPKITNRVRNELAAAKTFVESSRTIEEIEDEQWDTSMVAEYGDEIFAYMRELEVSLDNKFLPLFLCPHVILNAFLRLDRSATLLRPVMRPLFIFCPCHVYIFKTAY
jgi:G2/mitotic-specific cyclin 3/4